MNARLPLIGRPTLMKTLDLCYEISIYTKADCFFSYSPHVNSFDVQFFEFGWAVGAKGEYLAFSEEITPETLHAVNTKLVEILERLLPGEED